MMKCQEEPIGRNGWEMHGKWATDPIQSSPFDVLKMFECINYFGFSVAWNAVLLCTVMQSMFASFPMSIGNWWTFEGAWKLLRSPHIEKGLSTSNCWVPHNPSCCDSKRFCEDLWSIWICSFKHIEPNSVLHCHSHFSTRFPSWLLSCSRWAAEIPWVFGGWSPVFDGQHCKFWWLTSPLSHFWLVRSQCFLSFSFCCNTFSSFE